jgi:2-polyprenyl-6-methoxyphenol hydroxylase-like FAD-dependent oxidoreductase
MGSIDISEANVARGHLLVVGAGYGGLATAIELTRKGFQVEVIESVKQLSTQGIRDSLEL